MKQVRLAVGVPTLVGAVVLTLMSPNVVASAADPAALELDVIGANLALQLERIDSNSLLAPSASRGSASRAAPTDIAGFALADAARDDFAELIDTSEEIGTSVRGTPGATVTGVEVVIDSALVLDETETTATIEYAVHYVRQVAELPAGQAWEEIIPHVVEIDKATQQVESLVAKDLAYRIKNLETSTDPASSSLSLGESGSSLGPTSSIELGIDLAPMALSTTNKAKVAAYAVTWWNSRNPNFPTNYANDCTNFVSQALLAGGWTTVSGLWNSNSAWWGRNYGPPYASYPWGGAENFYVFARVNAQRTTHLNYVSSLVVGDILQYKAAGESAMTHTMVTTQKSGSTPFLTYHSFDTLHKPFSSLSSLDVSWYAHRV